MIGQAISHYRITAKLGEGGMGVVYRAEDTKLDRTVALKFIAANLIRDSEARKRFEREAKAAAGVSHANVCHVYEIAEVEERTFLAMEFVEGEGLDKRIERGPLSLKDALDIARQTAEGLAAAHAKGVVHRDIKPANLLVTPGGQVKILDFGLALLTEGSKLTQLDTKVGTVAYMSPEQAQGAEVDHRTDVWALGCVLYEMVCGQRPFRGAYDQALLYDIITQEAEPLTGIRAGVPMELEFIAGKCLAKDADSRYQHANELALDLRNLQDKMRSGRSTILRSVAMTGAVPATAGQTLHPAQVLPADAVIIAKPRLRALYGIAAALVIVCLGLLALYLNQAPPPAPERTVTRFSFAPEGVTRASISPDGRYILYEAQRNGVNSLWLRPLNEEAAREVPGTTGATWGFWSPDSSAIGFAVGEPEFALKRVTIDGGSPITLCPLQRMGSVFYRGGTWSPDGERIVFSAGLRLYEIAARGSQPKLLFDPGKGPRADCVQPYFLPSDRGPQALAYATGSGSSDQWVAVLNLETGERRELGPGRNPVYSPDGFLIHGATNVRDPGLWALPFSRKTLETTGEAFPISTAGGTASVSHQGTLAYLDQAASARGQTLVWRDRSGKMLETIGQPQPGMGEPALSPDGRRVAVSSTESRSRDVWIHDLVRSTKTRLTFEEGLELGPAWSPSGEEVIYLASISGSSPLRKVLRKAADGTGDAAVVVEPGGIPDWSRDGKYVVYDVRAGSETGDDILYQGIQPGGATSEPIRFLATAANESIPKLSPDGRYVAYVSDESGRNEIYVRSFPDGAGKRQASVNGGAKPRWRSDGGELYYVEVQKLMAVTVTSGQGLTLGQPRKLFESSDFSSAFAWPTYDVSADGQKFITITRVENTGQQEEPSKICVVENWYEEFRGRETK